MLVKKTLLVKAHRALEQKRWRVMQQCFTVQIILSYQGGQVSGLLDVSVVSISADVSIHGLQFVLTPVLDYGGGVTVSQHVICSAEPVTVWGE